MLLASYLQFSMPIGKTNELPRFTPAQQLILYHMLFYDCIPILTGSDQAMSLRN